MGAVNEMLGAHGAGHTIPIGGKEYTFTKLTQQAQSRYESWLELRAFQVAERRKPHLTREDYKDLLGTISTLVANGEFSFGGESFIQSVQSLPGMVELVRLILEPKHPEFTSQEVQKLIEDHTDEVLEGLYLSHPHLKPKEDKDQDEDAGPNA